ncbi:hypothetical protein BJV82DRAFT_610605 [Fennellomyces sp. T-0311]|nr:hypothetical protein BJV82DRAFT_610605 [Fennellomyces sp. T-0311]
MKASYIIAVIAALAVSANAWESAAPGVKNSKLQNQEANGNNGVYSSSDGSVVGAPGVAQKGVNILADETNIAKTTQTQKQ